MSEKKVIQQIVMPQTKANLVASVAPVCTRMPWPICPSPERDDSQPHKEPITVLCFHFLDVRQWKHIRRSDEADR